MDIVYKPDVRFLQAELKRISDLIQFTDRKSTFLLTFYSAIIGFFITQKNSVTTNISTLTGARLWLFWIAIISIATCILIGISYLIRTTLPSMRNMKPKYKKLFPTYQSIISYQEFSSEDELKNHLIDQIQITTLIADIKMNSVHKCSKNLFILVFLMIIFTFVF